MNFACNGAPTGAHPAFLALALERPAFFEADEARSRCWFPSLTTGLRIRCDYCAKGGWLGFRLRAASRCATTRRISRSRELGADSPHCRHSAACSLHFSGPSIATPILKIKPRLDRGDQRGGCQVV